VTKLVIKTAKTPNKTLMQKKKC